MTVSRPKVEVKGVSGCISYQKGKKSFSCGFSQSSCIYQTCVLHHWLSINDSSFQQNKLESLNLYTSKVIKLTKVSHETPSIKDNHN